MRDSLFIEELDGPTFESPEAAARWYSFESPHALAWEAEEYRQLSRAGA